MPAKALLPWRSGVKPLDERAPVPVNPSGLPPSRVKLRCECGVELTTAAENFDHPIRCEVCNTLFVADPQIRKPGQQSILDELGLDDDFDK
jgi:hypothetical protein